MNNLIEINEGNKVSARELYKFLGLNQSQFSRWAKSNIENNAFAEESVDFQGSTLMSRVTKLQTTLLPSNLRRNSA